MAGVIEIRGLGLAYQRDGQTTQVLQNLDLTIARGEFLAIVGESGVGKSTLLRVLIGLAQPSAGTFRINAEAGKRSPLALVFQDSRLLPWRRILDNVTFGLRSADAGVRGRHEAVLRGPVLLRRGRVHRRGPARALTRRYPALSAGDARERSSRSARSQLSSSEALSSDCDSS